MKTEFQPLPVPDIINFPPKIPGSVLFLCCWKKLATVLRAVAGQSGMKPGPQQLPSVSLKRYYGLRRFEMKRKIVIVDSEPVVRSAVTRILETAGYQVSATAYPTAALDIIKANPPDLVITNVYLPGMTGHEAMRMFKNECPGIRVLMVSGLPDEEVIQKWIQEEGFAAFPKPFSANALG